ncbi:hypothetical protein ORF012 [Anopheles sinensis]|uniref:Uncharacterized protein n=1 Tax=Anopheles sinensis TaxID=74873 RepID=A0A084WC06_ANOSI|nr:hypothetical protein ORF012 [Anopheles sinensis]
MGFSYEFLFAAAIKRISFRSSSPSGCGHVQMAAFAKKTPFWAPYDRAKEPRTLFMNGSLDAMGSSFTHRGHFLCYVGKRDGSTHRVRVVPMSFTR